MKKTILKVVTSLLLIVSFLMPPEEFPLSMCQLAHAAETAIASPTASYESGTIYCVSNSVVIKLSAENGAKIYYSLNGADYQRYYLTLFLVSVWGVLSFSAPFHLLYFNYIIEKGNLLCKFALFAYKKSNCELSGFAAIDIYPVLFE